MELLGNNTSGKTRYKCYINERKEKSNETLCTDEGILTCEKDHDLEGDGNSCENISLSDSATTVELDMLQNLGPTAYLRPIVDIEYVNLASPEELLKTARNESDEDEVIASVAKKTIVQR